MRTRTLIAIAGITLATLSGCSTKEDGTLLESLQASIEKGADCEKLYEIRDEIDKNSQEYVDANKELRAISCISRFSQRSNSQAATANFESHWKGVPGKKVTPAQTCIAAAEAASSEKNSTLAEPLIVATLDACTSVDEWMSVVTIYPGVVGRVQGYIPELLNLQSACYRNVDKAVCQDAVNRGIDLGD